MSRLLMIFGRAVLALCCGLFALPALVAAAPTQDVPTLVLRGALAAHQPAPSARPPFDPTYRSVTLPDTWETSVGAGPQTVWYRLDFVPPAHAPETLLAAYLPRACSNLEIHLNGQLLYRGGRMNEPLTRNCYHPQLVTLPSAMLRADGNRLDVQVVGYALPHVAARQRAGGISEVQIGPYERLASAQTWQLFWNVTVAQIVAVTLVLVGGIMIALSWVQRLKHLLYFGVLAIGWALLSARLWWRDIPLGHDLLELLTAIGFVPLAICGVQFVLRYGGWQNRLLDRLLWSQCLLMPLALAWAAPEHLFTAAAVCYTLLALQVFAVIAAFLWQGWRARRDDFWLMVTILGFVVLAVGLEVGIQDGWFDLPDVHAIHFAIPMLLCVLGFRLVQTVARALHEAETARGQLEQRVRDISADIERNFAHLAEVRVEQVAEKERKRIAADLHDDLGAKLLTIVHTSVDERISTLAREALEEMRLSVRGIAGKPVQLADALADWRAETVSRLGEAGIEIDWSGDEPTEPRALAARVYVQTTRILREATSNLIKHSGASRAMISCRVGEDFQLVIRDNGRGIPLELDGKLDRGHGMASMKQRAKQMQGQCLVESGPGYGTVIRLTLPL